MPRRAEGKRLHCYKLISFFGCRVAIAALSDHASLNQLRTPQFKIETWDAGWWQIKQALEDVSLGSKELKELKAVQEKLKAKLLPQIKEFGIIE